MTIELYSISQRKDLIQQLNESGQKLGENQLEFQGSIQFFDTYNVDLGFPCYRLANGRTQAAQKEIIAKEGLQDDFFDADPDSAEALESLLTCLIGGFEKSNKFGKQYTCCSFVGPTYCPWPWSGA